MPTNCTWRPIGSKACCHATHLHDAVQLAYELEQQGKQGVLDGAESPATRLAPLVAQLTDAVREYIRRHTSTR